MIRFYFDGEDYFWIDDNNVGVWGYSLSDLFDLKGLLKNKEPLLHYIPRESDVLLCRIKPTLTYKELLETHPELFL